MMFIQPLSFVTIDLLFIGAVDTGTVLLIEIKPYLILVDVSTITVLFTINLLFIGAV